MNRLFTLCIFSVILCSTAHAQLNKGRWLVGGNVNFSLSHVNNSNIIFTSSTKTTTLQATPGAGYFVVNKLAVGLRPGVALTNYNAKYNYNENVNQNNTIIVATATGRTTALNISPFVRYYFLPQKNKINLLADVSYTYSHTKNHQEQTQLSNINGQVITSHNEGVITSKGNLFSVFAGPAFFISPKIAFELLAGYTHAKYKDNSSATDTFGLSAGFQIHLVSNTPCNNYTLSGGRLRLSKSFTYIG